MPESRHILHASKVDEFAEWAATQGYEREETRGDFEKLRLRKTGDPPLIFHKRMRTDHLTVPSSSKGTAARLVRRWLNERGTGPPKDAAHIDGDIVFDPKSGTFSDDCPECALGVHCEAHHV